MMDLKKLKIDKAEVLRALERVKSELSSLQAVLKLKGAKYFQRPLAIGGIMVFACYHYVYQGTGTILSDLAVKVEGARATSTYAEDYKKLNDRIKTINLKLPNVKNPQDWLLDSIRKTLREEGIVPLSTSTPKEEVKKGYRFITITVALRASFPETASWVSRLERNNKLLYIRSLSLKKEAEDIGKNHVTVQVMTVVKGGGG